MRERRKMYTMYFYSGHHGAGQLVNRHRRRGAPVDGSISLSLFATSRNVIRVTAVPG